MIIVES